jgi:hypothetical protein
MKRPFYFYRGFEGNKEVVPYLGYVLKDSVTLTFISGGVVS